MRVRKGRRRIAVMHPPSGYPRLPSALVGRTGYTLLSWGVSWEDQGLDAAAEQSPLPESSVDPVRKGLTLTCAETQALFPTHLEEGLTPELVRSVETHLLDCVPCNKELRRMRTEEDLIADALRGLRPSDSYRGRVATMCAQVHNRASKMAESVPESRWAFFRYALGFFAVSTFVLIWMGDNRFSWQDRWPGLEFFLQEARPLFWINVLVFVFSLILLLEGRLLARIETYLMSRLGTTTPPPPTRLEIILFEIAGGLGVLVGLVFHYLFVTA